jgi:hypothetical protein
MLLQGIRQKKKTCPRDRLGPEKMFTRCARDELWVAEKLSVALHSIGTPCAGNAELKSPASLPAPNQPQYL